MFAENAHLRDSDSRFINHFKSGLTIRVWAQKKPGQHDRVRFLFLNISYYSQVIVFESRETN